MKRNVSSSRAAHGSQSSTKTQTLGDLKQPQSGNHLSSNSTSWAELSRQEQWRQSSSRRGSKRKAKDTPSFEMTPSSDKASGENEVYLYKANTAESKLNHDSWMGESLKRAQAAEQQAFQDAVAEDDMDQAAWNDQFDIDPDIALDPEDDYASETDPDILLDDEEDEDTAVAADSEDELDAAQPQTTQALNEVSAVDTFAVGAKQSDTKDAQAKHPAQAAVTDETSKTLQASTTPQDELEASSTYFGVQVEDAGRPSFDVGLRDTAGSARAKDSSSFSSSTSAFDASAKPKKQSNSLKKDECRDNDLAEDVEPESNSSGKITFPHLVFDIQGGAFSKDTDVVDVEQLKKDVNHVFATGGVFSSKLENYAPRAGQIEFADAVAETLGQDKQILMVEAGTGTGKTFSYLVPPILAGRRVVVSTGTKALQDQLVDKDIPNLLKILGKEWLMFMGLKGHTNYICRHMLESPSSSPLFSNNELEQINRYVFDCSKNFDQYFSNNIKCKAPNFAEMRLKLTEDKRRLITCDSASCRKMRKECPYVRHSPNEQPLSVEDDCYITLSRKLAQQCRVLTINHALFFASLGIQRPSFKDQSEQVPAAKSSTLGASSVEVAVDDGSALDHAKIQGTHGQKSSSLASGSKSDAAAPTSMFMNVDEFPDAIEAEDPERVMSILPKPDVLVFDEAHTLPEVGRSFFTRHFSGQQFHDFVQDLEKELKLCCAKMDMSQIELAVNEIKLTLRCLDLTFKSLEPRRYSILDFKYLHADGVNYVKLPKEKVDTLGVELASEQANTQQFSTKSKDLRPPQQSKTVCMIDQSKTEVMGDTHSKIGVMSEALLSAQDACACQNVDADLQESGKDLIGVTVHCDYDPESKQEKQVVVNLSVVNLKAQQSEQNSAYAANLSGSAPNSGFNASAPFDAASPNFVPSAQAPYEASGYRAYTPGSQAYNNAEAAYPTLQPDTSFATGHQVTPAAFPNPPAGQGAGASQNMEKYAAAPNPAWGQPTQQPSQSVSLQAQPSNGYVPGPLGEYLGMNNPVPAQSTMPIQGQAGFAYSNPMNQAFPGQNGCYPNAMSGQGPAQSLNAAAPAAASPSWQDADRSNYALGVPAQAPGFAPRPSSGPNNYQGSTNRQPYKNPNFYGQGGGASMQNYQAGADLGYAVPERSFNSAQNSAAEQDSDIPQFNTFGRNKATRNFQASQAMPTAQPNQQMSQSQAQIDQSRPTLSQARLGASAQISQPLLQPQQPAQPLSATSSGFTSHGMQIGQTQLGQTFNQVQPQPLGQSQYANMQPQAAAMSPRQRQGNLFDQLPQRPAAMQSQSQTQMSAGQAYDMSSVVKTEAQDAPFSGYVLTPNSQPTYPYQGIQGIAASATKDAANVAGTMSQAWQGGVNRGQGRGQGQGSLMQPRVGQTLLEQNLPDPNAMTQAQGIVQTPVFKEHGQQALLQPTNLPPRSNRSEGWSGEKQFVASQQQGVKASNRTAARSIQSTRGSKVKAKGLEAVTQGKDTYVPYSPYGSSYNGRMQGTRNVAGNGVRTAASVGSNSYLKRGNKPAYASKYLTEEEVVYAVDENNQPLVNQAFRKEILRMSLALKRLTDIVKHAIEKDLVGKDNVPGAEALVEALEAMSSFIIDLMTTDRDKYGNPNGEFVAWIMVRDNSHENAHVSYGDSPESQDAQAAEEEALAKGKAQRGYSRRMLGAISDQEAIDADNPHKDYEIYLAPIEIGKFLGPELRKLMASGMSIVFASATISTNNDFAKFCYDLGLSQNEVITKIVPSPFDYAHNARIMYSKDFCAVDDPMRMSKHVEMLEDVIDKTPGGVFFLTTSFAALREAEYECERRFAGKRRIFVQGKDSVNNLMADFRKDGRGILIGTSSFWEGVDVPGQALSLVIIDRIPFKQANDPVNRARSDYCEKRGGNPFFQISVPEAIIKLRQGVGRLIRNEKDLGALIILDPRLETKRYGAEFISSLPPMTRVYSFEEIFDFYKFIRQQKSLGLTS